MTLEADCKETQKARKGDKVTVHYGGFLQDGENLYVRNQLLASYFLRANRPLLEFVRNTTATQELPHPDLVGFAF